MLLSFEVLDGVLKHIETSTGHSPCALHIIIPQLYPTIQRRDVKVIVDKLYKDGNIDFVTPNKDGVLDAKGINTDNWIKDYPYYYITFEGVMLLQEGGYVNSYAQNRNQKRYERVRDVFLIIGSWMAGIGSLIVLFAELLKHLGWVLSINLMTASFLMIVGVLIGVCIAILLSHLNNKQQK